VQAYFGIWVKIPEFRSLSITVGLFVNYVDRCKLTVSAKMIKKFILLHDVLDASKHVAVQRQISEQLGRVGY